MDSENNPTPPATGAPGAPPAKTEPSNAASTEGASGASEVTKAAPPANGATKTTPASPPRETPAAGPAPREVPAGTPPAARVTTATGATKTTSTPTPAVAKGIPKAAAARQPGAVVQSSAEPPINKLRRRIVWASIAGFLATSFLMFLRFFLPRSIFEPSNVVRLGTPNDYGLGVDTKWQQQHRIWVVKTSDRLFVISAVCTHLGCTPDWKESENKFKCPCHGSGYDSEGVNFEGPAPRPMDRAHV
ncbi:MAG: Rieske 2Fe-2S domain-containing protein, partial [Pyrinomonadaceae bacterium]